MGDVTSVVKSNIKPIMLAFGLLFIIILVKSFFALNNTFDINEPTNDSYNVDTSFNTGIDDITNKEVDEGFFSDLFGSIDKGLLSSVLFLIILGVFVMFMGK